MVKKAISITLLAGILLILVAGVVDAESATIYVPDDYSTIQAAVDAANPGDTIIVRDGTYTENVNIDKDHLTIKSENGAKKTIVLAADPSDHVFEVTADYVEIDGFAVKGAGETHKVGIYIGSGVSHCSAFNNIASNNYFGIYLDHSSNNTLTNNIASRNRDGIWLDGSSNNIITNNSISNNYRYGTYLKSSSDNTLTGNTFIEDGLIVWDSHNNTIENNIVNGRPLVYFEEVSGERITDAGQVILVSCNNITVENLNLSDTAVGVELWKTSDSKIINNIASNNYFGIYLDHSSNNIITNNIASGNSDGINMFSSSNNTITNNTAKSNTNRGIYLYCSSYNEIRNNIANSNWRGVCLYSSNNNRIYLNNFTNNTYNFYRLGSTNTWNSPNPIIYIYNSKTYTSYLGNYWNDYTGIDADEDGIGNTPYNINSDQDNYPLMMPFENYEIGGEPPEGPYISSIEPSSGAPGITVTVNGKNFNEICPYRWVTFGWKTADVVDWSDDRIVVTVPYGQGTVDVAAGPFPSSNSVLFTYRKPVIDSIHPSSGKPGTEVRIEGMYFGFGHEASAVHRVKFGKTFPRIKSWSDNEIIVEAPWDYGTGAVEKIIIWIIKVACRTTLRIPEWVIDIIAELNSAGVDIRLSEGKIIVGVKVTTSVGTSNTKPFTFYIPEIIETLISSPGELRVYDAQGNVTGLVNGEIKKEISYSYYDDDIVLLAYPSGDYVYEVVGTNEGSYGLELIYAKSGDEVSFQGLGIPTSVGTTHRYYIDWSGLAQGEESVLIEVDAEGDGIFESTVVADNDLTAEEFTLQTETVIEFEPDVMNPDSQGRYVTVYIELPEGSDVSDIDVSSLKLNDSVLALSQPVEIGDYDTDGISDLMVKFDRPQVIEMLEPGEQLIYLMGRLSDGTPLAGIDIIQVLTKQGK